VDAVFRAIRETYPMPRPCNCSNQCGTEGTDAQATVSVRLEEDGVRSPEGVRHRHDGGGRYAYVNALNKLLVKREKHGLKR